MSNEEHYIQVRGLWNGAPSLFIGPFDSHEEAQRAMDKSGALPDGQPGDVKQDVQARILTGTQSRESGQRQVNTVPPREGTTGKPGFDVPGDLNALHGLFHRLHHLH